MPPLSRADFLRVLAGRSLDRATASEDPRLAGVRLHRADLNGDGAIRGASESDKLFLEIDRFDHDGSYGSVAMNEPVASMVAAVRDLSVANEPAPPSPPAPPAPPAPSPGPSPSPAALSDDALRSAFPPGTTNVAVGPGSPNKKEVVAIQYALGRLGHLKALADGAFGPKTGAAVSSFRSASDLAPGNAVDLVTLRALDAAVSAVESRSPAEKASSPLEYLSSFETMHLTKIELTDTESPIASWSNPEIQRAYGTFVREYWEVLKENRVEADCKTLALFFMDQFRKKLKIDTGVHIPLPKTAQGSVPPASWLAATTAKPAGFFTRIEDLPTVRPGYNAAKNIEDLDPNHSMLYGVNLRYAGVDADRVARSTAAVVAWHPSMDNGGDRTRPEVPIQALEPGHIIFLDHTGDGKFDHTVNVVSVDRDDLGKVRRLVLAVGSFDDMADQDASTPPAGLSSVNNYTEEVVVRFDADGRISSSACTWGSEPSYVSTPRYAAHNTLMELRANGTLKVGRWA